MRGKLFRVKSGKEEGKYSARATFWLVQHGTQGIEVAPEETFGRIAMSEAA